MAKIQGGWIDLDKYAPRDGFVTAGAFLYAPNEDQWQKAYVKLRAADASFVVYRRANVPRELHFNENPREGDPVIVARGPYAIRAQGPPPDREDRAPTVGNHGFDPYMMPEMKAGFYAEGPDSRRDVKLKPFENINVDPLIVKILGLESQPVDGSLNVLGGILVGAAR